MKGLRTKDLYRRLEPAFGDELATLLVTLSKGVDNTLAASPMLGELAARHLFPVYAVMYASCVRLCEGGVACSDPEVASEAGVVLQRMKQIVDLVTVPATPTEQAEEAMSFISDTPMGPIN